MLVCAGIEGRGWVIDRIFTNSILTFSGFGLDVTHIFFKIAEEFLIFDNYNCQKLGALKEFGKIKGYSLIQRHKKSNLSS